MTDHGTRNQIRQQVHLRGHLGPTARPLALLARVLVAVGILLGSARPSLDRISAFSSVVLAAESPRLEANTWMPSGPLIPSIKLHLSASRISAGETLTASITLKNRTRKVVRTQHIVVAARPPGGTEQNGPFDDFGRVDNRSLAPGKSVTVRMKRPFSPADPLGRWFVFVLYQTTSGHWYDATRHVFFNLVPGIVVTRPLRLSASRVSRGGTLAASLILRNEGNHTLRLQTVDLAARPPGGTKTNGPFDDFGTVSDVTLAPGQTITVTKSRMFTNSDPVGRWDVYAVAQLPDGTWEALSRDLHFTLTSTSQ